MANERFTQHPCYFGKGKCELNTLPPDEQKTLDIALGKLAQIHRLKLQSPSDAAGSLSGDVIYTLARNTLDKSRLCSSCPAYPYAVKA